MAYATNPKRLYKRTTVSERAMMKQIQAMPRMSEQEARAIVDKVLESVGVG
ncbi:hypothetical protein [Spirosoma luteum]|uniref:hypothetical protein n=1 Tax=Spirosoma luteum TaxID=431553 RepID=UPI00037D5CA5|nr:hypothetical protein [Spirosoma luteum]